MATPARRTAFEILLRVETQSSYAAELLHSPLTDTLSERDAALCTELVLGTLRWQRTLDFLAQSFTQGRWPGFDPEVQVALRLGLYQLRFLSRIPARAAVHETVELVKAAGKGSAAGLVNAVLRKGAEAELASLRPAGMSELDWWSLEYSHPAWLLEHWRRQYGRSEALALAHANNRPPVTILRVNPAVRSPAEIPTEIEAQLRREGIQTLPGNFLRTCLAVAQGNVSRTEVYRRGEIVIQDEASQMVPHLLGVKEGDFVLDLCAAPGNKTGWLAEWAGPSGCVVSCDVHLHRLRQLIRAAGLANVNRVVLDGEQSLPFRAVFDRALVDAPCSGTGTLRRNPEQKWRLLPADIPALSEKQIRLLESAASVLKEGGRLVYSTCSLEREENQGVVETFLQSHSEFHLLPLRSEAARLRPFFHPSAERLLEAEFLETSPARDSTDGFFAALLVKTVKPA